MDVLDGWTVFLEKKTRAFRSFSWIRSGICVLFGTRLKKRVGLLLVRLDSNEDLFFFERVFF